MSTSSREKNMNRRGLLTPFSVDFDMQHVFIFLCCHNYFPSNSFSSSFLPTLRESRLTRPLRAQTTHSVLAASRYIIKAKTRRDERKKRLINFPEPIFHSLNYTEKTRKDLTDNVWGFSGPESKNL